MRLPVARTTTIRLPTQLAAFDDLVFLKMFKTGNYQDISLAEWMAHTPHLLMNQDFGERAGVNSLSRCVSPLPNIQQP